MAGSSEVEHDNECMKRKYSDRKEYIKAAVNKRRRKLKQMAIEYKGGECEHCGYNKCPEVFDFHHRDPSKKDFGIGGIGSIAWGRLKLELDKCVLLCANCHREEHSRLRGC